MIWAVGAAAVVGHCFSPWMKLRGGKGVATGLGVLLVLAPGSALVGLLTFALGKTAPLPPGESPRFTVHAIDNPAIVIDAKLAAEGAEVYGNCAGCHGIDMHNIASFARDLRESTLASTWEGYLRGA